MKLPVSIHFVGLRPSPAVDAAIHARIAHIERHHANVIAWRVTIAHEVRHQQQGQPFSARVDVTLPHSELVVTRIHDEDILVAVREALDATQRKLDEAMRMRREHAAPHRTPDFDLPDPGAARRMPPMREADVMRSRA